MRIDPLEYDRPQTLGDTLNALAKHGAAAKVLGGGSDLVARMKLGIVSPQRVIDVSGVAGLNTIREEDEGLVIGAATPLRAIERSAVVAERFPALVEAAASVASFQIRSVATLAGNLCLETMCWYYNQSRQWKKSRPLCHKAGGEPCHVVNQPGVCHATYRGDTAVTLIALEAEVRIRSQDGQRVVPLQELFTGEGRSPLRISATELVTEVRVPWQAVAAGCAYRKVSHRKKVDYSQAAVAAAIGLSPDDGTCTEARIVLGAVAPGPVRATEAEELLRGRELTDEVLDRAAEAAVGAARPMNNMTFGSPAYRRKMVRVLGLQALRAAVKQARSGNSRGGEG